MKYTCQSYQYIYFYRLKGAFSWIFPDLYKMYVLELARMSSIFQTVVQFIGQT